MPALPYSLEPAPGRVCRACSRPLPERVLRCVACGTVHGENYRCPHCKAGADLEPAGNGRFRCAACGGPRIFLDTPDVTSSGREVSLLERAERARIKGALLGFVGFFLTALGSVALLGVTIALVLATPSLTPSVLLALAAALPLGGGLAVLRFGAGIRRDRERAIAEAELSVAEDVVRGFGREVEASELSAILHVSEHRAEELLAELSLDDRLERRVTEAGSLGYAPRIRVESPGERDDDLALEQPAERTKRRD